MMRPRAAMSWSGGNYSCLAFMRRGARDPFDLVLITMFGEDGRAAGRSG